MKNFKLILILFTNSYFFGQPILNESDFTTSFSANTYIANPTGFSVGNSGENQVWDFSNLNFQPKGTLTSENLNNVPYLNSFTNSNYFLKSYNGINDNYELYNLTTSKYESIGQSYNSGIIVNFSLDSFIVFEFPFTYNTILNDTYSTTNNTNPVSFLTKYDAYGIITTPFGTFNNVIRKKITTGTKLNYLWFQVAPFRPILEYIYSSPTNQSITIYETINLSIIQKQLTNNFQIYPNPTSGSFTIKNIDFSNEENFVSINDMLGNEIIKNKKIFSNIDFFDINEISSGLYFLKITNIENKILYFGKIIKN